METGTAAILIAAGSLAGVVISKFVDAVIRLRDSSSTTEKGVRQDTLSEYKDLLERQQRQLDVMASRLDAMQQENSDTERNYARAEERIAHLEDALTKAKIPFRPWKSVALGSGPNAKLPKVAPPNSPGDM